MRNERRQWTFSCVSKHYMVHKHYLITSVVWAGFELILCYIKQPQTAESNLQSKMFPLQYITIIISFVCNSWNSQCEPAFSHRNKNSLTRCLSLIPVSTFLVVTPAGKLDPKAGGHVSIEALILSSIQKGF